MSEAAAAEAPATPAAFDAERVRSEFPIFARNEARDGRRLVYLDSASSAQKPQAVLDAVGGLYGRDYANVHRGLYDLAARSDAAFEGARDTVARFLGGVRREEVIFTRGTTEALNLVARSFLRPRLSPGDEVLVSELEHHSNIVPWQIVCAEAGARVVPVPIDERGDVDLEALDALLGDRVRLLAVTHISNVLGTVVPVAEVARRARERGVPVVVDGAQAVPHSPGGLDVRSLGVDFYCFSSHKAFGPSGVGVLWGRYDALAEMPPYQGGGDMIRRVRFEGTEYADPPARFEAGTPNIAGVVGLAAALDYLNGLAAESLVRHEDDLLAYAESRLEAIEGARIVGHPRRRSGALSFVVEGAHPHDVAHILASEGIAVRAGHHCAQPLMDRLGLPATTRASFALYNTRDDVDALAAGLERVLEIFSR